MCCLLVRFKRHTLHYKQTTAENLNVRSITLRLNGAAVEIINLGKGAFAFPAHQILIYKHAV